MVRKITSSVVLLFILAIASVTMTRATETEGVLAGTDSFATLPGTYITFNGTQIAMTGNPAFAGGPDTVFMRLSDVTVPDVINSTATTATTMTLLALKSVAPVNFGGSFFDVYVDLDPGHVTTGSLTLTQTVAGEGTPEGTFTSSFNVFYNVSLTPLGQPKAACNPTVNCFAREVNPLNETGVWTDDTTNGVFVVGPVIYSDAPIEVHNLRQIATTPEPASLLLFGTGLLGIIGATRRKWIG